MSELCGHVSLLPDLDLPALLERLGSLEARVVELEAALAAKDARIAELERRLRMDSSRPPSSDAPDRPVRRSLREASGRRAGGQPGHPGATLEARAVPDEVREYAPAEAACPRCGIALPRDAYTVHSRHQVFDLAAPPPVHVVEHRVLACACPGCGKRVRGTRPADVPKAPTSYGPHIGAYVAYLSARHFVPLARLAEVLADLFAAPVSKGTVATLVAAAARRLAPTVLRIEAHVARAEVVGSDETVVREGGRRVQVWTWHSARAAYLARGPGRGADVIAREFPGGFPRAVVVTDRLAAQLATASQYKQVCLVHLLRECRGLGEARGASGWPRAVGATLAEVCARGALGRAATEEEYDRLCAALDRLLGEAAGGSASARPLLVAGEERLRRGMVRVGEWLTTCLVRRDVPADNNGSERVIRNVKVKVKVSGQWRTAMGTEAYAALRSVIETALKQGVRPLDALGDPALLSL